MSHTPEHDTWLEIRRRCADPKRENYQTHGARGIKVCDRWKTFENFFSDMGFRPSDRHSIDRINNNGNYEPSNCRWATSVEQGLNKRNNLIVTAFGKTAPLGAFIDCRSGKSSKYKKAWKRITEYGWDAERAMLDII
jgi:hypothetical protein